MEGGEDLLAGMRDSELLNKKEKEGRRTLDARFEDDL